MVVNQFRVCASQKNPYNCWMQINLPFLEQNLVLNGWKIWGLCGGLLFTLRWFVQMAHSKKAGKPVIPLSYWIISLTGSFMLLTYFIFGKNDSVGIVMNLLPPMVAGYNLFLELTFRKKKRMEAHG